MSFFEYLTASINLDIKNRELRNYRKEMLYSKKFGKIVILIHNKIEEYYLKQNTECFWMSLDIKLLIQ